jgi:hypothetical protein
MTVLDDIYPGTSTIELRIDAPRHPPVRASIGVGADPISARTILNQLGRHPTVTPKVQGVPAPSGPPATSATTPTTTATSGSPGTTTDVGWIQIQASALHTDPITEGQDVNLWVWRTEEGPLERSSVETGAWRLLYQKIRVDAASTSTRTASGQLRTTLTIDIPPEAALWIRLAGYGDGQSLAATPAEPNDPKAHQPDANGHVPGEPTYMPGPS